MFGSDDFRNPRKYFSVVDFDGGTFQSQIGKDSILQLDKFQFLKQRIGTHNIGITLIKLTETSFLRTVGTPHRLNLISLERKIYLVLVHYHITGKGHSKVVTEGFF